MTTGPPVTVQATFCATAVDEWARAGVRHAFVAPGSRSTPLALAVHADRRLDVHVFHDERAAGFAALGAALAVDGGPPAVVLTTSGTAAAHLHAAVLEAHYAGVSLVACTADRPPELRDVGAPQAMDQSHLYGGAVRWYFDPGVADDALSGAWRSIAARAVVEAMGGRIGRPGPVHLNLPFRDPLVGVPGALPESRPGAGPWHGHARVGAGSLPDTDVLDAWASNERGLVVAGRGCRPDGGRIAGLAAGLGWPVLADPSSGAAGLPAWHALLREPGFAARQLPGVVVRLGAPPASKVLAQWLAASGAIQIIAGGPGTWFDPEHTAAAVVPASPVALMEALGSSPGAGRGAGKWTASWADASRRADEAIEAALAAEDRVTEPYVARAVSRTLADLDRPVALVAASSMPVRDLEWYGQPVGAHVRVTSNRGVNGIDGTIATAIGVAAADRSRPVVALLGDVAFLHDSTALVAVQQRGLDLTLVVVDNDGGGIFSFLPQAEMLPPATFEELFGTPHGVRVEVLATVHGLASVVVEDPRELPRALLAGIDAGGTGVIVCRTDRAANVDVHAALHAAVARAITP